MIFWISEFWFVVYNLNTFLFCFKESRVSRSQVLDSRSPSQLRVTTTITPIASHHAARRKTRTADRMASTHNFKGEQIRKVLNPCGVTFSFTRYSTTPHMKMPAPRIVKYLLNVVLRNPKGIHETGFYRTSLPFETEISRKLSIVCGWTRQKEGQCRYLFGP